MGSTDSVVAGIDVGGPKKGFHGVALVGGAYHEQITHADPSILVQWCLQIGAKFVAVDAPCRWGQPGRPRAAESALMRQGISCFSTPTEKLARAHPRGYYDWMINGASLFAELEKEYPLLSQTGGLVPSKSCCETFPQAVACALAGRIVSAKQKTTIRRQLLEDANLSASHFSNIDKVDAALCALTAHHILIGKFQIYGDPSSGLIVVPRPQNYDSCT